MDSKVRQGCIISPWMFNVYVDEVMKGERFTEDGRECRLPGFLYVDDLVQCGKSEKNLRAMVGRFAEVCRRGLKVNAVKNKAMVLNVEEGLECEVDVDGIRLEHVSEFKYLRCVLQLECARILHETCLYLFLCMALRRCYGRRRDLELGLYRWTTSEDC